MGFILENNGNYSIQEIIHDEATSCTFNASNISVPSNAVGFVHTHPYSDGEEINDQRCLDEKGWDVEEEGGYPTYNASSVSGGDRDLVQASGLPLFTMDKDNIRPIEPSNPYQYHSTITRCGY